VQAVKPDTSAGGMSYALLSEYLPFDSPVPWTINGRYSEEALRNIPQAQVGVFLRGQSVRPLSERDFADLIAIGFRETLDLGNADRLGVPRAVVREAADAVQVPAPAGERERRVEAVLSNRIIRDASFRNAVYNAYENRCAITGLRIIDSRGNSEVHARIFGPLLTAALMLFKTAWHLWRQYIGYSIGICSQSRTTSNC
jgi:putative restriction endonuclease